MTLLPDWMVYGTAVALLVVIPGRWGDKSMSPPAPPPPGEGEMALFAAYTPFSHAEIITLPLMNKIEYRGTAFSVSKSGEWVLSRESIRNCRYPFLNVGGNLGVRIRVQYKRSLDNYVLAVTDSGARPLPFADPATIKPGMRGFMPGYPHGQVGEATGRLIGKTKLRTGKRFQKPETVLAWAEAGHTAQIPGSLNQLIGGPTLNAQSQVIGITLKTNPRRGRIYSSTPETVAKIGTTPSRKYDFEHEDLLTRRNYGVVSDTLRREYRVAQVGCIQS
ncbi:serine protease [Asticcacaulis sp. YBE204]|uniref:serine protease n=1 Tax=Asticcacaulis sp. YBE204 TaxID=1282363 RepID=UPI0003C3EE3B|nr:serine protease [Asticcacaulis sp. YBE204]ESQ77791.1 peptidase [Asticcacaulis sp. YBE204]